MTVEEARDLADEINHHPVWRARAEEQLFLDRDNHDWWVIARQEPARADAPKVHAIKSREEWEAIRARWR
jgi:hypothetical protein